MYLNDPIAPTELPRYGYVGRKSFPDGEPEYLEGPEAQHLHSNSQKVLRIAVKVSPTGSADVHRSHRSILQAPDDQIHLGGSSCVTDEDDILQPGCTIWADLHYDLRDAFRAVDKFVPTGWRKDANTTVEIYEGRQKGLALWRLLTGEDYPDGSVLSIGPGANPEGNGHGGTPTEDCG